MLQIGINFVRGKAHYYNTVVRTTKRGVQFQVIIIFLTVCNLKHRFFSGSGPGLGGGGKNCVLY